MFLTILDLILILILFLFIAFSFWFGLIQVIGGLVGLFLGAWLAAIFYQPFGQWLTPILLGKEVLADIIAFIVIFTVVNRLVGFVFHILNKIFNIIAIIPFSKFFNRLAGALLGFLEGILFLGIILYFIYQYSPLEWINQIINGSKVAIWLISFIEILKPLLPEILKQIQAVV